MDDQAAGVADVGEVAEQFYGLNGFAGIYAIFHREGEDGTAPAIAQVFFCERIVWAGGEGGVVDLGDFGMTRQKFGDLDGVGAMALHAHGQRFDAVHGDPCVHRLLVHA